MPNETLQQTRWNRAANFTFDDKSSVKDYRLLSLPGKKELCVCSQR
jgi:hypothetical protein